MTPQQKPEAHLHVRLASDWHEAWARGNTSELSSQRSEEERKTAIMFQRLRVYIRRNENKNYVTLLHDFLKKSLRVKKIHSRTNIHTDVD